jgi:acyl carrier protein
MTPADRGDIIEQLKAALMKASNGRARLDRFTDEALIIEDIGLASLDLLELRFELEERWNMRISDTEALQLRTIRDVVELVRRRNQA